MVGSKKNSVAPASARLARDRAALKRELDAKLRTLRALLADQSSSWDRAWELIGEIVDHEPPLWRGAFGSESEFIGKELSGETMRSVRRNVIVARAFTAKDVEARGVGVLEEIALYLMERDGASSTPRAVDLDRVLVVVPKGAESIRVPGREVDIAQARTARRALRGGGAGRRKIGPEEREIRRALGTKRTLKKVSVRIAAGAASFGGVPLEALGDLGAALRAVKVKG